MLLGRPVVVLMLTSSRKMLMPQGAPTVQCMMYSAMVFMSFTMKLVVILHKEVRAKCFLTGWLLC